MLYIVMLLLGALLVLVSDRFEPSGVATLLFVAGEAIFGTAVVAASFGLLGKVIAVLRSHHEQEDT